MESELIRRRQLPHWDVPGAAFFVTTCLEASIPARGLLELEKYRRELRSRPKPPQLADEDWQLRLWKLGFARAETWLDSAPANRVLEDPALANIVVNSLFHFAGERYDLLAYVVMPSHVHWLFRPLDAWVRSLPRERRSPRERIVYSVNRFTATRCNRLLGRSGAFWQTESYDHWVRDVDELERIIHYIEENPVKAGLVKVPGDFPFSSIRARSRAGVAFGLPIPKPVGHA
jgi:type I restriction enzyme R subunit